VIPCKNTVVQVILDHKDSKVREALQVYQVSQDLQVLLVHQENEEKRATGGQKELALKDPWGHEDYQVCGCNRNVIC
jgi:hypothetical protein